MCGIAGFAVHDRHSEARRDALAHALARRGPDGTTAFLGEDLAIVHTRLAIVDLSDRVRYPLVNERGNLRLAFNGEIYNHRSLRTELQSAGHRFVTSCDAEVVLHGFEEWGVGCFGRLSGMFALALVDEQARQLVLARDRFGIKPLVVSEGPPFAFASDAMALVAAGLAAGAVDADALRAYAFLHYVPAPATGVAGVAHVEPGTAVVRHADGRIDRQRFAPVPFAARAGLDQGPAPSDEELEQVLGDAVERHLMADVEVGVLLSGGTDSRLIAALAAERGARPRAYTLSFPGSGDYDESCDAANAAQALGLEHVVHSFEASFGTSVEGVVDAFDSPFADASAIATLQIAAVARRDVKVVLSGTGGDDLFAGYYRHRAHLLLPIARALHALEVTGLGTAEAARGSERSSRRRLLGSYASRLLEASSRSPLSQYADLVGGRSSPVLHDLVGIDGVADGLRQVLIGLGLRREQGETALRAIQRFESRTYLPYDLLVKEDRATMAVGLESRVPMLDPAVLETAERYTDWQKRTLRAGKRPLHRLAGRRFPERGYKRGFAVPLDGLLNRGPWTADAAAWLEGAAPSAFDGSRAATLLREGRLPATDAWALCVLAGWELRLAGAHRPGSAPATPRSDQRPA